MHDLNLTWAHNVHKQSIPKKCFPMNTLFMLCLTSWFPFHDVGVPDSWAESHTYNSEDLQPFGLWTTTQLGAKSNLHKAPRRDENVWTGRVTWMNHDICWVPRPMNTASSAWPSRLQLRAILDTTGILHHKGATPETHQGVCCVQTWR